MFELIYGYNGGYDEDVEEVFETYEEAEKFAETHGMTGMWEETDGEEGYYLKDVTTGEKEEL